MSQVFRTVVVVVIVCVIICMFAYLLCPQREHLSNTEAINNVASLYNNKNMSVSNINVLNDLNIGSNKISSDGSIRTNEIYGEEGNFDFVNVRNGISVKEKNIITSDGNIFGDKGSFNNIDAKNNISGDKGNFNNINTKNGINVNNRNIITSDGNIFGEEGSFNIVNIKNGLNLGSKNIISPNGNISANRVFIGYDNAATATTIDGNGIAAGVIRSKSIQTDTWNAKIFNSDGIIANKATVKNIMIGEGSLDNSVASNQNHFNVSGSGLSYRYRTPDGNKNKFVMDKNMNIDYPDIGWSDANKVFASGKIPLSGGFSENINMSQFKKAADVIIPDSVVQKCKNICTNHPSCTHITGYITGNTKTGCDIYGIDNNSNRTTYLKNMDDSPENPSYKKYEKHSWDSINGDDIEVKNTPDECKKICSSSKDCNGFETRTDNGKILCNMKTNTNTKNKSQDVIFDIGAIFNNKAPVVNSMYRTYFKRNY